MRIHLKAVPLVEMDRVVPVHDLDLNAAHTVFLQYAHCPVHQGLSIAPAAAGGKHSQIVYLSVLPGQIDLAEADDRSRFLRYGDAGFARARAAAKPESVAS